MADIDQAQIVRADAGLPRDSWRDWVNELRLDAKFRYVPFRAYYRFRAWKYAHFRTPELGLLRYVVDPRRTSLDVGANLGLVTYFLARHSRHVHAFEPNPIPLRVLRHVVDANVTVHQAALSDRTGEADLLIHRGPKGWTSNGAKLEGHVAGRVAVCRVPCSRIDDLGIADIGFIKVDVEGLEDKVLAGAEATIARDRPSILLECEYIHVGDRMTELFARMRALRYQGLALIDGRLQTLSHFSVRKHQIETDAKGGTRPDYVRNFLFLPD